MNRTTHDKKSKGAKAMCTSYFQNPISSLHSHFAYKIFNDGLKFRACLVWNKEWYIQKCSFWLNILYSTTPPFLHHCQMPVAGLHWGPFWQSLKHLWSGSACGSVPLADSYRKRWLVSRFVLESHIRFGRTLWTGPSQDSVGYEMQSLVSDSWSVSKMLSLINIAPFRMFLLSLILILQDFALSLGWRLVVTQVVSVFWAECSVPATRQRRDALWDPCAARSVVCLAACVESIS